MCFVTGKHPATNVCLKEPLENRSKPSKIMFLRQQALQKCGPFSKTAPPEARKIWRGGDNGGFVRHGLAPISAGLPRQANQLLRGPRHGLCVSSRSVARGPRGQRRVRQPVVFCFPPPPPPCFLLFFSPLFFSFSSLLLFPAICVLKIRERDIYIYIYMCIYFFRAQGKDPRGIRTEGRAKL